MISVSGHPNSDAFSIVPSKMNVLLVGIAHEHKSHVVSPSDKTGSSIKNGGLGGGGTKRPLNRPFSLASNGRGELKNSAASSKNSNVADDDDDDDDADADADEDEDERNEDVSS